MRLPRSAAACSGLLLLLPALAACGEDQDSAIKVGDIVNARQDDQFVEDGTRSIVALPLGRLEVIMGKPTAKLAANETRELEAISAPANSTFIPITWQYDAGTFGDYADYIDTEARPEVDVVADGAKYRLSSPESTGEGAESFYLLVNGDASDASLSVGFDGVVQTVDLATGKRVVGDAAALYKLKPRQERTASCATKAAFKQGRKAAVPDYSCSVTRSARIPYAGDAWAEAGSSWEVVTLTTTLRRYDTVAADYQSGAVYGAVEVKSSFALGKIAPTKVFEDRGLSECPAASGACTSVYHLVFKVDGKASDRLLMKQKYQLNLASVWGGGEGSDELQLDNTLALRLR